MSTAINPVLMIGGGLLFAGLIMLPVLAIAVMVKYLRRK